LDALTGAVHYQFGYNPAGLPVTVTDGDSNTTAVERDAHGNPTAIVGPYQARTPLTLDPNGYLDSVSNPAVESVGMTYRRTACLPL
jgi:YD repeat-containing protein